MKIDRRRPIHWLYLAMFLVQCLLALLIRSLRLTRPNRSVVMYGHKLNGNLLALHESLIAQGATSLKPAFLTMDPGYSRELRSAGVGSVWACGPQAAKLLAGTQAVISDHGLHSMQPMVRAFQRTGVRFFDVWHGIPFKGFDAGDFQLQHLYDEVWVASDLCRALYIDKFRFDASRVVSTGYARTDRLVLRSGGKRELRASLGLPIEGRMILFAPTWKQDMAGRNLFPFGCEEIEFLGALAGVARKHGASVILRSHLNSGNIIGHGHPNVHALPGSLYPDAEAILLASDMLVCDWSSISFDFLLLDRPTFFLDVEPPFRRGFSLGPEYRFGCVVQSMQGLLDALDRALTDPRAYWQSFANSHREIRQLVYGDYADGNASKRCIRRLQSATD